MNDIVFGWWELIVILLTFVFLGTLSGLVLCLKNRVLTPKSHLFKDTRGMASGVPQVGERSEPSKPRENRRGLTAGVWVAAQRPITLTTQTNPGKIQT